MNVLPGIGTTVASKRNGGYGVMRVADAGMAAFGGQRLGFA